MPTTQTQTVQSLVDLISRSKVISEVEKKEFLQLLPSLSTKQIEEVANFFLDAEKEISQLNSEFHEKQSQIYTEYLPKIHGAFESGQTMVHSAALLGKFKNP